MTEDAEEVEEDRSDHDAFASPAQDGQYSAGFAFVVPSKEQYPIVMDIAEVLPITRIPGDFEILPRLSQNDGQKLTAVVE